MESTPPSTDGPKGQRIFYATETISFLYRNKKDGDEAERARRMANRHLGRLFVYESIGISND